MKRVYWLSGLILTYMSSVSAVVLKYNNERPPESSMYQAWYEDIKSSTFITSSSERKTKDLLNNRVVYEKDTKTLYMNSEDAQALLDSNTRDSTYTKISFKNAVRSTAMDTISSGPSLDNLNSNTTNSLSLSVSTEIGATLAYVYGYTLLMTFTVSVEHDLSYSISTGTSMSCDAGPGEFVQVSIQLEVESWNNVEVCGFEIESESLLFLKLIEEVTSCELISLESGLKQSPSCLITRRKSP